MHPFVIGFVAGTAVSSGLGTPVYDNGIQVTSMLLDSSSPAYEAGIRTNDIILQVDHEPIVGSETAVEGFVKKVRSNLNHPLELQVLRGGGDTAAQQKQQIFETTVTPRTTPKGKVSIGVGINAIVKEVQTTKASNPIEVSALPLHLCKCTIIIDCRN